MSDHWDFISTKTFEKGYAEYPYKKQINQMLEKIKQNPYKGIHIKKLQGEWSGYYRFRKGNFRLIYQIQEPQNQIILVALASRGSIY